MNSLSFPASSTRAEGCTFVSGSRIYTNKGLFFTELCFNPSNGVNENQVRFLQPSHRRNLCKFSVSARFKRGQKHDYPWPDKIDPNDTANHLKYLSRFKPLAQKPKPVILNFEKPLIMLQKKITDVRKMADETGLDFTDQINLLEMKYQEAVKDLYTHLTPFQRLTIARHPNRPTFLDHVTNITEKWVELHGDRAGYDDPAISTGLGSIDGKTYMFIGHQKGRNTKENIFRNFGMPTPHGYRKALRMMKYADHHGFPIITFIDTPGAFADLKSEELGQGEAIAQNLRSMFGLKVPIVSIVIGEGGSGGALAIGCANKLLMLENAVFYVASPEACAAILWKTSKAAPKAAEKLKITAAELCRLKIADGIIPEPLGGAHTDPTWTSQQIKLAVTKTMKELNEMDTDTLLNHRHMKFRQIGGFRQADPQKKQEARRGTKKETTASKPTDHLEAASKKVKKEPSDDEKSSKSLIITPEKMKRAAQVVEKEMADAFVSMGLKEKLNAIKMDISKEPYVQNISPALKERIDQLAEEFKSNLNAPGSYEGLKKKLTMFSSLTNFLKNRAEGEELKKEINEKLQSQAKEKMELIQRARESLTKGEKVDSEMIKDAIDAKENLIELFKSANFEVVGVGNILSPSTPPVLLEKMAKADEVILKEIARAMDSAESKSKVAELRAELQKGEGRDMHKVGSLIRELKEGVFKTLDQNDLNSEVNRAFGFQAAQGTIVSPAE